jgi:hypothetical protein
MITKQHIPPTCCDTAAGRWREFKHHNKKMKKATLFFAIFLPLMAWAHEDKSYTDNYRNVTIRFKTGFFYEEINNARIIAQYAAFLCEEMSYDKPVFLDFIHDYGRSYQNRNFTFIEIGLGSYDLVSFYKPEHDTTSQVNTFNMVPLNDTIGEDMAMVEKHIYSVAPIDSAEKIIIRQFGFHFSIENTLKMLHYALSNQRKILSETKTTKLDSYLNNMYYKFQSIPKEVIDSIGKQSVPALNEILEKKVYREKDSVDRHQLYYSYFSKGNKYHPFAGIHDKEFVLDTLSQIYSFDTTYDFSQSLFVFESPTKFRQYNEFGFEYEFLKSKIHKIPIENYEYITSIDVEWLGDDIFLINYYNGILMSNLKRFLYLKNDDILITNFESYLDSFRRK